VADVLAAQLPVPADADVVTLCSGANDAGWTAPADFRESLRQVCAALPDGATVGDVPEFQWGPRITAAAQLSTAATPASHGRLPMPRRCRRLPFLDTVLSSVPVGDQFGQQSL